MSPRNRYDSLIVYYALRYHRDPRQVKRQIFCESAFDPKATSPAGAMGLMQFMPATWREWHDGTAGISPPETTLGWPASPFDPELSIRAGCAYMAALEAALGTLPYALAAYNWGIGRVRKALVKHPTNPSISYPPETREYIIRCLDYPNEPLVVAV